MAKIFEVRYKRNNEIVSHQHATEHFAKIDAKAISKEHGRSLLGEMDYEANTLFRVCEFAGGVQGRWENRNNGPTIPCKVLLTVEDTKQDEPTGIEAQPKTEISDEEKAEKKALLAKIREQQDQKSSKPERKTKEKDSSTSNNSDKYEKLIARGYVDGLAKCICAANLHIDSPNYNVLVALWNGYVSDPSVFGLDVKGLNALMVKLRALLVSNNTGKSIVTSGGAKNLTYRLVDFKLEIQEDEVA